jgi:hypothetical protein
MTDLSDKVHDLTIQYLGPAADMFLERQTDSHMNGLQFSDLRPEHLPVLAKWINVSAGLVIEQNKATELAEKVKRLA